MKESNSQSTVSQSPRVLTGPPGLLFGATLLMLLLSRLAMGMEIIPTGEEAIEPCDSSCIDIGKNIIFVIDHANLPVDENSLEPKRALTYLLSFLDPDDLFDVISSGEEVRALHGVLVFARSGNVKEARSNSYVVGSAEPGPLDDALRQARSQLATVEGSPGRPCAIVVVSNSRDGVAVNEAVNRIGSIGSTRVFNFEVFSNEIIQLF